MFAEVEVICVDVFLKKLEATSFSTLPRYLLNLPQGRGKL